MQPVFMERHIVASDVGFSNNKAAWRAPGDQKSTTSVLPSGACEKSQLKRQVNMDVERGAVEVRLPNGETWVAGVSEEDISMSRRVLDASYPKTKEYMANLFGTLYRTGYTQVDVLVVGLPVKQFIADLDTRKHLQDLGYHTYEVAPGRRVEVGHVEVMPQPLGTMLSAQAHDKRLKADLRTTTLVIDPGFFSVDWVTVQGLSMNKASSGSSTMATSIILAEASALARDRGLGEYSVNRFEDWVRRAKLTVQTGRGELPVWELAKEAAERKAELVAREIRATLRVEDSDIDWVVVTGGGAELYAPAVRQVFGAERVVVPDNPVIANAEGYLVRGLRVNTVQQRAA